MPLPPLTAHTLAEEQETELLALMTSNTEYYAHMREPIDRDSMLRTLHALPPGARAEDKTNTVHLTDGELVGFTEVVVNYPEPGEAIIGLLMVDASRQRRGFGTRILASVLETLASHGTVSVFLSYPDTSNVSRRFWLRHGFRETGDCDEYDDLTLVAMQLTLHDHAAPPS